MRPVYSAGNGSTGRLTKGAAMGLRESYNRFLDGNEALNELEHARDAVRDARRGHVAGLLGALVAGSVCSMGLSFLASVMGYGNAGASLVWSLLATIVSMFVGNIVFVAFLLRVRGERLTFADVQQYGRRILMQIGCMIVLSLANTLAANVVAQLTAFDAHINVFCSVFVSILFTLANAVAAFAIYDGERSMGNILAGAFKLMGRNWAPLLGLSILFIAWTFIANVAYASLLAGNLSEVQTINNIFHALLNARDYALLGQVGLFYGVNYIVGGLFEIAPLLGIAWCYENRQF